MFYARDLALVEAGKVLFAGGGVEGDVFWGSDGDLALFRGWSHVCDLLKVSFVVTALVREGLK